MLGLFVRGNIKKICSEEKTIFIPKCLFVYVCSLKPRSFDAILKSEIRETEIEFLLPLYSLSWTG
jgi:hypothetical protein